MFNKKEDVVYTHRVQILISEKVIDINYPSYQAAIKAYEAIWDKMNINAQNMSIDYQNGNRIILNLEKISAVLLHGIT